MNAALFRFFFFFST
ncbi:pheST operon leader peptide PheM [Erwinia amylovora]|nr:pheST operon leader peptide PheM [Erwinia amylovora]